MVVFSRPERADFLFVPGLLLRSIDSKKRPPTSSRQAGSRSRSTTAAEYNGFTFFSSLAGVLFHGTTSVPPVPEEPQLILEEPQTSRRRRGSGAASGRRSCVSRRLPQGEGNSDVSRNINHVSRAAWLDGVSDSMVPHFRSTADGAFQMGLNLFTMYRAAEIFPSAIAGSFLGGVTLGGLSVPFAAACVPIVAPFNTPPVPYDVWCKNKRAVAWQRTLMFMCVGQTVLAMHKFFSGNLMGGFFDAMIAGTGIYAASPDGVTTLGTFIAFAGFNGVMDLLQVMQTFQGMVPLYLLPFQYPAVRPLLLLAGCFFTYMFHKELSAIFEGTEECGNDGFFVKIMAHDFWGTSPGCAEAEERRQQNSGSVRSLSSQSSRRPTNWGGGMLGGGSSGTEGSISTEPVAPVQPRFAPFGGEGRRLGADANQC